MRPVLILQNLSGDGPATLGSWLQRQGVAFEVRDAGQGHDYPQAIESFGALAVLGGEMSANDEMPHLRRAEALIRGAMACGVPTIGHCLGGQLMARALGAVVRASPQPEIGWQPMQVLHDPLAQGWLGAAGARTVFHWHYESFDLPAGATLLARSDACPHQAFAIGPHLAMQFHVEVDEDKLLRWMAEEGSRWSAVAPLPTVDSAQAMRAGIAAHLANQQALAERIYTRWLSAAVG